MTTTTTTQAVTTMVPTIQTKTSKTMRRKQTTTNLYEISMPALKTWMSRLNHYPVRWKVWKMTRKKKRLNDWILSWSTSPSEALKAGGSTIGVSFVFEDGGRGTQSDLACWLCSI